MKQMTVILILAVLGGCGGSEAPPEEPSTPAATEKEATAMPETTQETPAPAPPPLPSPQVQIPDEKAPAERDRYTVKQGDTLYALAKKYDLDYHDLAEWNGIRNPNLIKPGQEIWLSPPP